MKVLTSVIVIAIPLFTSVALVSSCASRRAEVVKGRTFVPANARIANGERVFMTYCQKCHPGGEAGIGPAINANVAPQFIKRFQVRHGLGAMPSFKKDVLTKSDLKDLSKYLRAWKKY